MNGTTDKVKGRVEEAVGVLTNDKKLKNRGKVDQAAGNVKDAIGKTIDKAVSAVNRRSVRIAPVSRTPHTNLLVAIVHGTIPLLLIHFFSAVNDDSPEHRRRTRLFLPSGGFTFTVQRQMVKMRDCFCLVGSRTDRRVGF